MRSTLRPATSGPAVPAVVVHGGAGSADADAGPCHAAARIALARLDAGGEALDAAVAAVIALEDDGRFNAGVGASPRMDGTTIETDAAVMDTLGRLGAVAALRDVRNPVKVARAVVDTPHWLLAGEGACRFAGAAGLREPFAPSPQARERHRRCLRALAQPARQDALQGWVRFWNFERPWSEVLNELGTGTVGAVVRDGAGQFAVATSTGGSMPQLLGRVGDTPIVGCGYYAGSAGAVAATGVGEHIAHSLLAARVYGWIEGGLALQEALDRGVALVPAGIDIGLIGITREHTATAARRSMACAIVVK